jgi:hypothetical protein
MLWLLKHNGEHAVLASLFQVTWKKWALTPSNVSVVVAVAWWTVAHVFRPDHPLSAAVQVGPGWLHVPRYHPV